MKIKVKLKKYPNGDQSGAELKEEYRLVWIKKKIKFERVFDYSF